MLSAPSRVALAVFFAGAPLACRRAPLPALAPVAQVFRLTAPRRGPQGDGRVGDLVLASSRGARLVFATGPDLANHRPLRGAAVDLSLGAGDSQGDALWWWRGAWIDGEARAHPLVADVVEESRCPDGTAGVRSAGLVDGVHLETLACVDAEGRFSLRTRALDALPPGATLGDELHPGPAQSAVEGWGVAWEELAQSQWVGWTAGGVGVLLEGARTEVRRRLIRIAAETFRSEVRVRREPDATGWATRTLRVERGDWLDVVALRADATWRREVRASDEREGTLALLGGPEGGRLVLGEATLRAGETRALRLPESMLRGHGGAAEWAVVLRARDDRGLLLGPDLALRVGESSAIVLPRPPAGTLRVRFTDGESHPLPVHVLFRGLGGTAEPQPHAQGRSVAAGRSLYLLDGRADVALAPGRYHVTATHGTAWSLAEADVEVRPGGTEELARSLRQVVDTTGWVSADFHLHSAPSPDSDVTLSERVVSLLCEGLDVAVPTDHNRVSDFTPALVALGQQSALATAPGVEVTSAGPDLLGHFNAWPVSVDDRAPEAQTPPYYQLTPQRLFEAARAGGAAVLQVNHARMPPRIGYFDLLHLDAATGRADANFSESFEVLEAFNGMWLETPERVREGLRDVVALARRGKRVAVTGNSDSHHLLFEEAGWPRTWVRASLEPSATRLRRATEALLRGESTVSAGPFVEVRVGEHGPGSVVRPGPEGRVRLHVRVQAPAWVPVERVELWVDDRVVQSLAVPPLPAGSPGGVRYEGDLEATVSDDAVLLVWADASAPLPDVLPYPQARAMGFSGPLYVDANGDGRVRVPPAIP